MSAKLQLVERMTGSGPHCTFCQTQPRDEESGKPLPAVTSPGVDVNFGDNLYICFDCAAIAAELLFDVDPRKSAVQIEKLHGQVEFRNKQVEKLQKDLATANDRIDKMLDGARAKKEAKASREKNK